MASPLDALGKYPAWQLALGWVGTAVLLAGVWYMLYYADAVEERGVIQGQFDISATDLSELETKLANFEQEMEKAASAQREIDKAMEFLPLSQASLSHLMRTFQQHGRLAGLTIDRWSPGAEKIETYYARRPVQLEVHGSWNQAGEFFRRVSEMRKIVNIEELKMTVGSKGQDVAASEEIDLSITFTANTFRFLTDLERKGNRGGGRSSRKSRRRKK